MPPLKTNPKKSKQHRSAISEEVKRQICEWAEANESKRHVDIANHFNEMHPNLKIDRSTISKILLQSDKWKQVNAEDSVQTFRNREVKFPVLEYAMSLWVENATASGVVLTDLLIKEKAKTFAEAFNIQEKDLTFSNGWLHKFKRRNNIRRYRIHGESGSAPLASLSEERTKLQSILGQYTLDRIYNIDETVSFQFLMIRNKRNSKLVTFKKVRNYINGLSLPWIDFSYKKRLNGH